VAAITVNTLLSNDLDITGDGTSTYGDTLTTTDVNYSGGHGGTISWSYGEGTAPTTWTPFSAIGSLHLDAGTYTVRAIQAASPTTTGKTVTKTLTIAKKDITPTVTLGDWTYGTPNNPVVSGNTGGGTVSYQYFASNGTTELEEKPTNTGTYFVQATVPQTANYNGGTTGKVSFTISRATVASIRTTVSDVTKTAYEARNATTGSAVVTLANLPSTVTVNLTGGGTTQMGIAWTTVTTYDAKGTTYAVTGTLGGTDNVNTNSVTDSVNIIVTAVTAANPTFTGIQIVTNDDTQATAAELGISVLPTRGNITAQGETIAYTVNWNGGQTIDRTDTTSNTVTFTGAISYTDVPAWLTIPASSVSRAVTVADKTMVTITGLSVTDTVYTGAAHDGYTGTIGFSGGTPTGYTLTVGYTGTAADTTTYAAATAPTKAGSYTVSVTLVDDLYMGSWTDTFEIAKANLTLAADNKSMTKGEELPSFTYTVSGLQNSETAVFDTAPHVGVVTDGRTTGTFQITFTAAGMLNTGVGANYTISARTSGTLTVNAFVASQLVMTGDGASTYGDVLTTADVNYSGGNGAAITWSYGAGTAPSSWTAFELSDLGTLKLHAGTYTIKGVQAQSDLADGATVTDTLMIAKKQISIDTANSVIAAKTYDGTRKANITSTAFSGMAYSETLTLGTDYTVSGAAYNDADAQDANTVTARIALQDTRRAGNYTLTSPRFSKAATISKATVTSIATTVSNVTKTAYEVRGAATNSAVVALAVLPSTVTVNLAGGGTAGLGITWSTATAYNARGTTYAVTGTLIGTGNYETNGVTDSVNVIVTPVTATNPSFPRIQIVRNEDTSATAAALGESILPTSGNSTPQGMTVAYEIVWGAQTIDRTNTVSNAVTFTGVISYTNAPAWLTIPDHNVSRIVTVVNKAQVAVSGLTVANAAYTGSAYNGMSGTLTVSGGSVEPDAIVKTWTSTDESNYSSTTTAPTNAGTYKLTLSVPETDESSLGYAEYPFVISKVAAQSIATNVSTVTKTANEARDAKTNHAVVALANLPSTVTVNLTGGGTAELGVSWVTETAYNAAGTTYAVTGTLIGTSNYDANGITDSVNVIVTSVSAANPTFAATQITTSNDSSVTADELGENVLPTSGTITTQGQTLTYIIDWNGGETIDSTAIANSVTFTGAISYIDAPAWITFPANSTVSRTVTVENRSSVTISGLTLSSPVYTGAAYNGVSGTLTVYGGSIDQNDLLWTWTSTDGGGYQEVGQSNAPINAGAYKLTISVPNTNTEYRGSTEYTFSISKADLTISTGDYTVKVGQPLPAIVLSYYNFVGRDTKDNVFATLPVASHTAANTNAANTYPIEFTAHAVLNLQNYNITETPGTLTVAQEAPADNSGNDNDNDNGNGNGNINDNEASAEPRQDTSEAESEEAVSNEASENEAAVSVEEQESESEMQESEESLESAYEDGANEGTFDTTNNEDVINETAPAPTQQIEAENESGGNVALPIIITGGVLSAGGIGIGGGIGYYVKFIKPKHTIRSKKIIGTKKKGAAKLDDQ
jgi:hypothetical protein